MISFAAINFGLARGLHCIKNMNANTKKGEKKMTKEEAKRVLVEIQNADLDDLECAYVYNDGQWEIKNSGCQPSNTVAIGLLEFDEYSIDVLADDLSLFFESYALRYYKDNR